MSQLRLLGAPHQLKQVIVNLLTNACKYVAQGSIVLRCEVADRADLFYFAVEDTGPGVSPEVKQRLFDPFVAGVQPGTGLGLPLCRNIVELMRGQLALESTTRGGSIFSFSIPLTLAPEEEEPIVARAPRVHARLKVLVADDQRINRQLLIKKLRRVLPESSFHEAELGEDALQMCLEGRFDLVFMDEIFDRKKVSAPLADASQPMSGLEVTREIRTWQRANAAKAHPCVIVGCTGNTGEKHNALAMAAGQDAVWGKPTPTEQQMATALSEMLARKLPTE